MPLSPARMKQLVDYWKPFVITHRDSTRTYDSSIDGESRTALDLIRREACNGLTAETVLGCYSCTRGPAAQTAAISCFMCMRPLLFILSNLLMANHSLNKSSSVSSACTL